MTDPASSGQASARTWATAPSHRATSAARRSGCSAISAAMRSPAIGYPARVLVREPSAGAAASSRVNRASRAPATDTPSPSGQRPPFSQ